MNIKTLLTTILALLTAIHAFAVRCTNAVCAAMDDGTPMSLGTQTDEDEKDYDALEHRIHRHDRWESLGKTHWKPLSLSL